MSHPTPTKTLLTTTFEPLVLQLSSSLARGARVIHQFVQAEPTPQTTMAFELELRALFREVGRRIMAWTCNHFESETEAESPSRVEFDGCLHRRRRKHPRSVATLFGPVTLRRRLYDPLGRSGRSLHPLKLRLAVEAGLATPALAERVRRWATDHSQQEVLEMLQTDHGVHWSCASLRKVLSHLRAGMAPHRERAQVDQLLNWLEQARVSQGRFRPTLSVGRDGIFVRLRHGVWQEGATATVSVLDRRGKRVGTSYLGLLPKSDQGTITDQLSALLKEICSRADSQSLRLVYVTDEGYHPSDYYHRVLKKMGDPRRPWCRLDWKCIVNFYHACQYVQQLGETIFGAGDAAQRWAKQMRYTLKLKASDELKLPPSGVNKLFTKIFTSERHFIPRTQLPFGVSR